MSDITPAIEVMFPAVSFGFGIWFFCAIFIGFMRWIKEMLG